MLSCPNCGSSAGESERVCAECGAALAGSRREQSRDRQQTEEPERRQRDSQPGETQSTRGQGPPRRQTQKAGQWPQEQNRTRTRQGDGTSRRALLAGGGLVAAGAAAGGWLLFVRDDGGSPDSPGTDIQSAPEMSAGTHGPYEITEGEDHYFAVDLNEGDTLRVEMLFSHDEGDLDIVLLNEAEEQVDRAASIDDNETASHTAGGDGTYYINPYGFRGASNQYELRVEIN